MSNLNINLDEKTTKIIRISKAIARRTGDTHLDMVHVLKAAILVYPEEAAFHIREAGGTWSETICGFVTPTDGPQVGAEPMPLAPELAAILRDLNQGSQTIPLETLLKAILHHPNIRVTSLLSKAQGGKAASVYSDKNSCTRSPSYDSRRDWLAALHCEWQLRRKATRLKDASRGYDESGELYHIDDMLDAVARVSAANCRKANATPVRLDPLVSIRDGLDELQRRVCEGVLVDTIYDLGDSLFGGLPVRAIARMLAPELYPGNCRKVLDAVGQLEERSILAWSEPKEPVRLTSRVHLTEEVFGQLLADMEADAISAGELREMKRQIRLGADW